MGYEKEQLEYRKELEAIDYKIKVIEDAFKKNPSLRWRQPNPIDPSDVLGLNGQESFLANLLSIRYGIQSDPNSSDLSLQLELLKLQRGQLIAKVSESRTERNISKTIDFIDDMTPKHVSGKIYSVSDRLSTISLIIFIIVGICTIIGIILE